jgi:glycerate-2-kinase
MKKIKNFEQLAFNELREDALRIAEIGLESIDTQIVMERFVQYEDGILTIKDESFSLAGYKRIFIIGIGKCSLDAAYVLEAKLDGKITDGVVLDVRSDRSLQHVKVYEGSHPLPSDKNIDYTRRIISLLNDLREDDIVLFIISGGGSTLLSQPKSHTCQQETEIIDCLLKSGATIQEINTVRKHLSLARGGYLAKYAYPARVISLIFSDVPGNNMEFVASGPTVKDSTTVKEARHVAQKYVIQTRCGFIPDNLIETPKDDIFFENVTNIVLISNTMALEAMAHEAEILGYTTFIRTDHLSGETREVGKAIVSDLTKEQQKIALLYGGETTVTVAGSGSGGRSQELALSALRTISEGQAILAFASDGKDNGEHAGALCDILTKKKAKELGLNPETYLIQNDSYHFFEKTGDYIFTGHTGSNVSDLVIAIKK